MPIRGSNPVVTKSSFREFLARLERDPHKQNVGREGIKGQRTVQRWQEHSPFSEVRVGVYLEYDQLL